MRARLCVYVIWSSGIARAALRLGFCELRIRFYCLFRRGMRTGAGAGTGFCGTSSCSSSFFKRPSIGLTFSEKNETRVERLARSFRHKQKTPSTVWEGPDS